MGLFFYFPQRYNLYNAYIFVYMCVVLLCIGRWFFLSICNIIVLWSMCLQEFVASSSVLHTCHPCCFCQICSGLDSCVTVLCQPLGHDSSQFCWIINFGIPVNLSPLRWSRSGIYSPWVPSISFIHTCIRDANSPPDSSLGDFLMCFSELFSLVHHEGLQFRACSILFQTADCWTTVTSNWCV